MSSNFQITTGDKVTLFPHLLLVVNAAIFRLVSRPFISGPKAKTALKDVAFAGLRKHLSDISNGAEQWMNASTEATYREIAKKKGFQPAEDVLDSGTKVLWIGSKDAEKVLLYCHGGGYSLPCGPGHVTWLYNLQKELSKKVNISVVLISYTLAPYGPYPTQLKQAVETLDWLIKKKGKDPSDILLGGDSAGGNMSLALLSHLLHPHPQINTKITLNKPLAGALLISPWVTFRVDDKSTTQNEGSDLITGRASKRWSSIFLGSSPLDNYNQPVDADAAWWKGLDSVVKDIFVWGGSGEILIDSIDAIAKTLKEAHPRTQLVVEPGAAHEEMIIDCTLGYDQDPESKLKIEQWITDAAFGSK